MLCAKSSEIQGWTFPDRKKKYIYTFPQWQWCKQLGAGRVFLARSGTGQWCSSTGFCMKRIFWFELWKNEGKESTFQNPEQELRGFATPHNCTATVKDKYPLGPEQRYAGSLPDAGILWSGESPTSGPTCLAVCLISIAPSCVFPHMSPLPPFTEKEVRLEFISSFYVNSLFR